jgi:alpha-glucosidase
VYQDDGVSTAYQKGAFLRESFTCAADADGIKLHIAAREGSYTPWWNQLRVEVYGQGANAVTAKAGDATMQPSYDAERQAWVLLVPDEGRGGDLSIARSR